MTNSAKITVSKDGPYIVEGGLPLSDQHIVADDPDASVDWREGKSFPKAESYALCRCGQSRSKPFCDGSHKRTGFDGTERASREPYEEQAKRYEGPKMVLDDAESLCAGARFCDRMGSAWNLVQISDRPRAAKTLEEEATRCPSGRLVARHVADGKAIEPKLPPSIGLIQDDPLKVSGPIWVRGGVQVVSADGREYEVRNRVTLCRCGASQNKPFCDGTHASMGFRDRE
jgi:CDGSH-type Zn-finger protein